MSPALRMPATMIMKQATPTSALVPVDRPSLDCIIFCPLMLRMLGWFLLIAFLSERKGMGNILNKNLISEKLFLNLDQFFTIRKGRGF